MTSDRIELLDAGAEVFYRRLMSKVDDHGLYDARPSVLRTSLYPLRVDRVREADCSRWIAACEKAGLIALYQHAGKPYLQMLDTRWTARSEPKFPLPTTNGSTPMSASENGCKQVKTPAPVFGVVAVDEVVISAAPSGAVMFDEFWTAYPKKKAKDDAQKAFVKRKPDRALLDQMLAAIAWQRQSEDWVKEGGKFVPYPATWLNDGRWTDEKTTTAPTGSVTTVPGKTERDPELTRIEIERARAVPMPAAIREQIAKIKQGAAA